MKLWRGLGSRQARPREFHDRVKGARVAEVRPERFPERSVACEGTGGRAGRRPRWVGRCGGEVSASASAAAAAARGEGCHSGASSLQIEQLSCFLAAAAAALSEAGAQHSAHRPQPL